MKQKIKQYINYSGNKKYRSLIFSLSAFSFLVVSIMMLSLYISKQLEKDAKIINTAFEQTSLLNQLVSDLYIINSQYNTGKASSFTLEHLGDKIALIDQRILAFKNGGKLPIVSTEANNDSAFITIAPTTDKDLLKHINTIDPLWAEYKRRVNPVLSLTTQKTDGLFNRYQFYGSVLHKQGAIHGLNRINLHTKTDQFALQLQQKSNERAEFLRLTQIAGILITALSLALILFFVIRQLRRSDKSLESAREEAKGILNTVQEGLFLIHKDRTVGSEYSSELESILETNDISGREISAMLGEFLSEKDTKNLDSFIKSLFNAKVVATLIMDLNPLKNIKVKLEDKDGTLKEKHLSFSFYRVIKQGAISDILVSTKDVTDHILLQQTLTKTKNKNEEQVKDLVTLIKIAPSTLQGFFSHSATIIKQMNNLLKEQVTSRQDFQSKIYNIAMLIHTLKGDASAIGLKMIAERAHTFEDELERLKNSPQLKGISFLPLTIQLEELISSIEDIAKLTKKIQEFGSHLPDSNQKPLAQAKATPDPWLHLNALTHDMAIQYNKKVDLITCGLSEVKINSSTKNLLNSVFIHLIKNSLVHGIELPEERIRRTKSDKGRIDIRALELPDGTLEVIVRDDGKGLDTVSIAKKLVEKGIATVQEIQTWTSVEVNKYIFEPGFSTANVDLNAGRGVGLASIYSSIKKMGGTLRVQQQTNRYCQFSILLPLAAQQK